MFELYASVYSTLVARHIPGKRNVLADSPSKGACGNRRMDPQPFGLPRHLSSLGVTHHRPLCRKTKHSASYLRVSDTRHDQVNRRHVPRLEGYVGVQVPTRCHTSFATDLSDATDLSEDSTRFAILAWSPRCGRCMLFRTTSTTASRLPSNTTVAVRSAHIGQDSRILPTSGYLRGSYPAGPRLVRLFGASGRMRSTVLTGFHIAIYDSK